MPACLVEYWWTNDPSKKKLLKQIGKFPWTESKTDVKSLNLKMSDRLRSLSSLKIGADDEKGAWKKLL